MMTATVLNRRKFVNPSLDEISTLWRHSVDLEAVAPASLRGGLARTRTALLEGVPAWELPAFLDRLAEMNHASA